MIGPNLEQEQENDHGSRNSALASGYTPSHRHSDPSLLALMEGKMDGIGMARAPILGELSKTSTSAVTWSAILAGAVAAAAISIVLFVLGSAIGLTAASPWPHAGMSAGTFGKGAAAWLIVVQWAAAALGGYLTGRLRTKWVGVHSHEVFFRDTAHGFLAWALSTVFAVTLVALAASAASGRALQAGATVAAGAAQGGLEAVDADRSKPQTGSYLIDTLFRSNQPPTAGNPAQTHAEASRILLNGLVDGSLSPTDKAYLDQVVAREAGITEADASQRVDDAVVRMKAAEDKARQVADQARKSALTFAFFTALSLMVGAFIASAAAALGGRLRDEHEVAVTAVT